MPCRSVGHTAYIALKYMLCDTWSGCRTPNNHKTSSSRLVIYLYIQTIVPCLPKWIVYVFVFEASEYLAH